MEELSIKGPETTRWDCVSLGEVMLRLDPGEGRIHTARHFTAWEGGGEYNVARGLRRCFGLRTAVATTFTDNPIGRLVEDFALQGGAGTEWGPRSAALIAGILLFHKLDAETSMGRLFSGYRMVPDGFILEAFAR